MQSHLGLSVHFSRKQFFLFIFERESMNRGGAERDQERERQSRAGSVPTESDLGLELTNHEIMTCFNQELVA